MFRFKVVVPSFNSADYLSKTLHSLEIQTDKEFDVCVIDDGSTIKKQREIILDFCQRNHWQALLKDENKGALQRIVEAIPLLNCNDQDVIISLDGDDWLAHAEVLAKLRGIYKTKECLLTWGQCEVYPFRSSPIKYAQPAPEMVIQQKFYRDYPFIFWQLRTFKYLLWKNIQDSDLRDANGEYFRIMSDKAFMFPMAEMAGKKVHFVDDILYIYNIENPLNDYATTRPEENSRVDQVIRAKKRYATLE